MSAPLRPTRLEISLAAISRNARMLRSRIPEGARMMAVVKADAYGHGAVPAARAALSAGAEALAVAMPEEGAQLREAGLAAPILVLGGITRAGAEAAAAYGLSQTVFDAETAAWLEAAARKEGVRVDAHLKIDSGMGRIGLRTAAAALALAERVTASPHLRLAGVFTHFATADGEDLAYTQAQAARFEKVARAVRRMAPEALRHAANSAALLRRPDLCYDMARAGIALYTDPGLPGGAGGGLETAMRWVTRAVQVKEIEPGETVGYGRAFAAERPTRVMTLPVGYADGYHRCIGGAGRALVRGRSAPVIGRVCMDQAMLDVTDIPGACMDDEVVLLGSQGGERVTVAEMGAWCGMIGYEVLLSPTARVPKVYTDDA